MNKHFSASSVTLAHPQTPHHYPCLVNTGSHLLVCTSAGILRAHSVEGGGCHAVTNVHRESSWWSCGTYLFTQRGYRMFLYNMWAAWVRHATDVCVNKAYWLFLCIIENVHDAGISEKGPWRLSWLYYWILKGSLLMCYLSWYFNSWHFWFPTLQCQCSLPWNLTQFILAVWKFHLVCI